jgi:hypothetical protein
MTDATVQYLEGLIASVTTQELAELSAFISLFRELKLMTDDQLQTLRGELEDKGNPNRWNVLKAISKIQADRSGRKAGYEKATSQPYQEEWEQPLPPVNLDPHSGTQVPPYSPPWASGSWHTQGTRPQPGDE